MKGIELTSLHNISTKADFQNLMLDILNPLKPLYSKNCAGLHIGETFAHYDIGATYMEAFSRPLWALVPFWAGGGTDSGEIDFADIYRRGLIAGSDPESEEYWGECVPFDQRFVEMAAISYGILFAPEVVWNPLSDSEKSNLAAYLNKINDNELPVCNWILFAVLVNIAMKKVGMQNNEDMLERYLDGLETFYLGNGWYRDGDSYQKDYYISFAIHFYSLIYASVMENEDRERSQLYKERALLFAKQFIYWFDEDGDAIPFGRSLTYRFSQVSFFSACLIAGIEPFPIPVMKGLIVRHLEEWLKRDIFDRDGVLTIGYGYTNLNMSERYNAPGSPYWGMKTFAFLMLPDDHPFWSVQAEAYPKEIIKDSICACMEADMLLYHYGNHVSAFVPGVYSPNGHGHIVEKYSKFAYDSKFSISVSRSQYVLCECVPDDMLAFMIDDYYYVRRICQEHEITDDSVLSKWSPYPGIVITTRVTPNEEGHVRIHEIESSISCIAIDNGYAVRRDDLENVNLRFKDEGNVSLVKNKYCECSVSGYVISGEGMKEPVAEAYNADPNTNLMYQRTMIPAVKYEIPVGKSVIKTVVKACWYKED